MKISQLLVISTIITVSAFSQEKIFYLKSGDKVSGIIMSESDSSYTVGTSFGNIIIKKSNIKQEEIFILLKSGDKIQGTILSESDKSVKVKTNFGEVVIGRDKIDRIDFRTMDQDESGFSRPGEVEIGRWYYSEERLIDIFFDPTGYPLEKNVLYLSGLSWGFGLTDQLHITSNWGGYFIGDLNFRPKFMVFKKGNFKSEKVLSIGAHFHMRGLPNKYELKTWDAPEVYYNENGVDSVAKRTETQYVRIGSEFVEEDLDGDGVIDNAYYESGFIGSHIWWEFFGAYTISNLRESGQGRFNHTIGLSLTSYRGYDLLPRVYYAINADVRRNLKLIFEVFWDPYWMSTLEFFEDEEVTDIDFDFGFIYAYNEKFRIGIHFQRPFIAFYYKF